MFSLGVVEDVREVEKFLVLFFFFSYKSGTFLYNPFFSFHLVVLDFVGKVRKRNRFNREQKDDLQRGGCKRMNH